MPCEERHQEDLKYTRRLALLRVTSSENWYKESWFLNTSQILGQCPTFWWVSYSNTLSESHLLLLARFDNILVWSLVLACFFLQHCSGTVAALWWLNLCPSSFLFLWLTELYLVLCHSIWPSFGAGKADLATSKDSMCSPNLKGMSYTVFFPLRKKYTNIYLDISFWFWRSHLAVLRAYSCWYSVGHMQCWVHYMQAPYSLSLKKIIFLKIYLRG